MNKQIIEFGDDLSTRQLGNYYKKHNGRVKKSIKKINETIELETKVEKKNLEEAVNKFQTKVKKVMDREDIKIEQTNVIKSKTKMVKATRRDKFIESLGKWFE